jgi:lipoate-protein ligase A
MEGVALAERKRRSSTDVAVKAMQDHLASVLTEMEQLGIVTQLAGKVEISSGYQRKTAGSNQCRQQSGGGHMHVLCGHTSIVDGSAALLVGCRLWEALQ